MTATAARPAAAPAPGVAKAPAPRRRRRRGFTMPVFYAVLALMALIYIYPFLINIATSFKTDAEAPATPLSLIPATWSTLAYERLFLNSDFPRWFANSTVVAVLVTLGRVLFDSLAGYALARLRFRGRGFVFAALIAVMSVPGVVLLIPKFLVVNTLGMYDSYSGLIIPLLADAAGIFIMKNFFESIPQAVEEAARLDGAGTLRTFWSVVLPMAQPALIAIVILSFQGSWNELSHFVVASSSPELFTLTKGVANLASGQLGSGTQYPLRLAAAVIMTVPVAVLFIIFQRRLTNAASGALSPPASSERSCSREGIVASFLIWSASIERPSNMPPFTAGRASFSFAKSVRTFAPATGSAATTIPVGPLSRAPTRPLLFTARRASVFLMTTYSTPARRRLRRSSVIRFTLSPVKSV